MEKLLIMGGSYFIGKHVVDTLKDRYDTYVLNRGSRSLNDDRVTELVCDRNDHAALKRILQPHVFSYVVDISAFNGEQVNGLLCALDLPALKRYVFISTSAVYDIHKAKVPFREEDALGGNSPFKQYAQNKIIAEAILKDTLDADKLTIFRPPFVYGEDNYLLRERLFFHLIENDRPIYLPKTNNHIHFVYVKDLAMDTAKALKGVIPPDIYNVGYDHAHTFQAYINLCASVVGKPAIIRAVDHETLPVKLQDYFPFFAYDNVLSVKKIKAYAKEDTPIKTGLENAYHDYLAIRETFALPEKMVQARQKIATCLDDAGGF